MVIGVLVLFGLVLGLMLYFATASPVVGRIVDARTGQRVGGNVCEALEYPAGFSMHTERITTFSRNGWFFLGPRVGSSSGLLDAPHSRWIVLEDPWGECWREVGLAVNLDGVGQDLHSGYFPVVLEQDEHNAGYHAWDATWRKMGFPLLMTVQLIPHLENAADCGAIPDATLPQHCRQLNTYLAVLETMVKHKDDPQRAESALGLCNQLSPEAVAKSCQKTVNYMAGRERTPRAQEEGLRLAFERDHGTNNVPQVPIGQLFPKAVAGIARTDLDIVDCGIGSGRAGYRGTYTRDQAPRFGATVTIEEFRDRKGAREGMHDVCGDFAAAYFKSVRHEAFSPYERVPRSGTKTGDACWISGRRVVSVEFAVRSSKNEEFVEDLLQKYSSSF